VPGSNAQFISLCLCRTRELRKATGSAAWTVRSTSTPNKRGEGSGERLSAPAAARFASSDGRARTEAGTVSAVPTDPAGPPVPLPRRTTERAFLAIYLNTAQNLSFRGVVATGTFRDASDAGRSATASSTPPEEGEGAL